MLSAAEGATINVTMEAALWARVVHTYPIGLISPCLGLGLSISQPGWVLALFPWVRLSMLRPVGLPTWSGLRSCRAGREDSCPEGAPAQPGEGGPSFLLPLPLFFEIFVRLYCERSLFNSHCETSQNLHQPDC